MPRENNTVLRALKFVTKVDLMLNILSTVKKKKIPQNKKLTQCPEFLLGGGHLGTLWLVCD